MVGHSFAHWQVASPPTGGGHPSPSSLAGLAACSRRYGLRGRHRRSCVTDALRENRTRSITTEAVVDLSFCNVLNHWPGGHMKRHTAWRISRRRFLANVAAVGTGLSVTSRLAGAAPQRPRLHVIDAHQHVRDRKSVV